MSKIKVDWKPGERLTYYPESDEDDGQICNDAGQQIAQTYCDTLGNFLVRAAWLAEWMEKPENARWLNEMQEGAIDPKRVGYSREFNELIAALIRLRM